LPEFVAKKLVILDRRKGSPTGTYSYLPKRGSPSSIVTRSRDEWACFSEEKRTTSSVVDHLEPDLVCYAGDDLAAAVIAILLAPDVLVADAPQQRSNGYGILQQ
jgi:hypothetical protein